MTSVFKHCVTNSNCGIFKIRDNVANQHALPKSAKNGNIFVSLEDEDGTHPDPSHFCFLLCFNNNFLLKYWLHDDEVDDDTDEAAQLIKSTWLWPQWMWKGSANVVSFQRFDWIITLYFARTPQLEVMKWEKFVAASSLDSVALPSDGGPHRKMTCFYSFLFLIILKNGTIKQAAIHHVTQESRQRWLNFFLLCSHLKTAFFRQL